MEGEREPMLPEESPGDAAEDNRTATTTGTTAAPADEAELQALVDKLTTEKNELKDLLLRKQAELENFRKRTQREKEEFLHVMGADGRDSS